MKAEVICIGTELLLGHIVNTNAAFIAKKLAEIGIDHYFQTTVGDNPQRLSGTIRTALSRSDIVITSGGLGPTVDDITTQTIAGVVSKKLVLEKTILNDINDYFKKQNRKTPKDSLRQALIPEGAKWLKNPFGTAPGLIIEHHKKIIIALPGPPREMNPMVENLVIPYLKTKIKTGQTIKSKSIKLIGLPEAKVNERAKDLLNLSGAVTVGIYARVGEVELKIMAKAQNEKSVNSEIKKIEKIIHHRFKNYIYGIDNETLEEWVGKLLTKKRKTLAIAESCTGGLISNLLTNIPGASGYFREGIIAYANESKIKDLGIPEDAIKKYGAVSRQVAKKMAIGIKRKANVDIGIAATGIAGPTGAKKTKPIGLVFIALATKNKTICRQYNFLGTRTEIKLQTARAALNMLRCELL
ncbi:MAG: competence/damage-inducible protein A [Candidatus Omnitrophica bacterium]|nr:competence/damage-inducible protein A [Candidatus Omnitrophota bacterium]